ncbi:hypothetical protein [Pseudomonas sp. Mn2068]
MRVLTNDVAIGKYTQGSIFNCLRVSDGSERFGIVVTARCDIAHQKARNLVCLPIYHLSEWMDVRGNHEVAGQSAAAINNIVSEILGKYQVSSRAIDIYGLGKTLEILGGKGISAADRLKLEVLEAFIVKKDISVNNKILKENRKKYMDGLIRNQRSDTFFVERLICGECPTGYVVDLSEPICLSKKALIEVSKGLEYVKYCREKDTEYKNIIIQEGGHACFVSTLLSPYVELLLQRFSGFYSRVGTQDISKKDMEAVRRLHEID